MTRKSGILLTMVLLIGLTAGAREALASEAVAGGDDCGECDSDWGLLGCTFGIKPTGPYFDCDFGWSHEMVCDFGAFGWDCGGGNHASDGACGQTHSSICDIDLGNDRELALDEIAAMDEPGALQVHGLLRRHPATVDLNIDRNALQVRGCSGTVLAHVPLSGALVREVTELASE